MIFINNTPKNEVKIERPTASVNDTNDGVTNEEQTVLLSGLFQDNNMNKNKFK